MATPTIQTSAVHTPTFMYDILQVLTLAQAPFQVLANTTLNEALNVGIAQPPVGGYPKIGYIMIGRGGHKAIIGPNQASLTGIQAHSPTDANLFEPVPFKVVPATADLDPVTREKFRLRVPKVIMGEAYIAYYGMVVTNPISDIQLNVVTQGSNGLIISSTPYVPGNASLAPTPITIDANAANLVSGKKLVASSDLTIALDAATLQDISDAITLIYNNDAYGVISEIALVSGFDYQATDNSVAPAVTYTELRAAQCLSFISNRGVDVNASSLGFTFTMAASEALPPNF